MPVTCRTRGDSGKVMAESMYGYRTGYEPCPDCPPRVQSNDEIVALSRADAPARPTAAEVWRAKAAGLDEAAAGLRADAERCRRQAALADWHAGPRTARESEQEDDEREIAAEPVRRVVEVFPLRRLAGAGSQASTTGG